MRLFSRQPSTFQIIEDPTAFKVVTVRNSYIFFPQNAEKSATCPSEYKKGKADSGIFVSRLPPPSDHRHQIFTLLPLPLPRKKTTPS